VLMYSITFTSGLMCRVLKIGNFLIARSSLAGVLSRVLVSPYGIIQLLSLHFSRFALLIRYSVDTFSRLIKRSFVEMPNSCRKTLEYYFEDVSFSHMLTNFLQNLLLHFLWGIQEKSEKPQYEEERT